MSPLCRLGGLRTSLLLGHAAEPAGSGSCNARAAVATSTVLRPWRIALAGLGLAWLEKREVAAFVGTQNLLRVEPGIAARGIVGRRTGGGGAPFQFILLDQEIDAPRRHRET